MTWNQYVDSNVLLFDYSSTNDYIFTFLLFALSLS